MQTPVPTYIHLGMPKTGTTSLQRHLFPEHSQIHYLGKIPGYGFPSAVAPVLLNPFFKSSYEMKYAAGDIHLQNLEQQLKYAAEHKLRPLLSREGLAAGTLAQKRQQAERFKAHFGHCKAILFVREPESFMKSLYTQMLKAFQKNKTSRADWMELLGEAPHYFDINEWMQAAWHSRNTPEQDLCYAETAGIYADVFGRDNVGIFIFEEFVRSPQALITKLCDYIGIDAEEGFRLIDGKRENDRKTNGYIELLQAIERSPSLSQEFRSSGPKQRMRMLTPVDDTGLKIMPVIAEEWLKKIHALGDAQNRRLVNEWGLPLADYGYRV